MTVGGAAVCCGCGCYVYFFGIFGVVCELFFWVFVFFWVVSFILGCCCIWGVDYFVLVGGLFCVLVLFFFLVLGVGGGLGSFFFGVFCVVGFFFCGGGLFLG